MQIDEIFKIIQPSDSAGQIRIENLELFISLLESSLDSYVADFGWSRETLVQRAAEKEQRFLACPVNSAHDRISSVNFEKHVNRCKLKAKNYTKQDIVNKKKKKEISILKF